MNKLARRPEVLGFELFNDLFKDFFSADPYRALVKSTAGFPVTDMFWDENGNQVIEMALAGFTKDNLEVEVRDNSIIIRCTAQEKEESEAQRKIARRSFEKRFVDYHNQLDLLAADVKFDNGLLSITLPKVTQEKKKPKLLEIKTKLE